MNFIYILFDEGNERLADYVIYSEKQELNMNKEVIKWANHPDLTISSSAKKQVDIKDKTTEELIELFIDKFGYKNKKLPKHAGIRDKCMEINDHWGSFDLKYRGLSSWQHGDSTRMFLSSSVSQLLRIRKIGHCLKA